MRSAARRPGSTLPETDVHALSLVFELLETVLLHERQQAFHFPEVYTCDSRTAARCCLGFLSHLELEKFPWRVSQIFGSRGRDNNVVLNADAPEAFHVNAWLDGQNHSLAKDCFFAPAKPRHFVYFQAQTMAGAMRKVLRQLASPQSPPCRAIYIPGRRARPNRVLGRLLSVQNRIVEPANLGRGFADVNRARHIAAVAADYSTLIEDDQFAFADRPGGRSGMRPRRTRPGRHDGFKGRP